VHSGTSIGTAVSGSNGIETNYDPGPIDNIYVENTDFYYNANGGGDLGCNSASDVLTNITFKKCKFYANACGGGTDGIGIGHFGTKANISFIRCEAYDNLSDGFDVDAPVFMDGCIAHDNDKNGPAAVDRSDYTIAWCITTPKKRMEAAGSILEGQIPLFPTAWSPIIDLMRGLLLVQVLLSRLKIRYFIMKSMLFPR